MRKMLATLALLLVATPVMAQQWYYEDMGTPIAFYDNGVAQFQFACRGGDLAMGFWVRSPSRAVAGASSLHLAMVADPAAGSDRKSTAGASFAQDMPLIHADGTSMIVRGPVARNWARIAQQAQHTIRVAYVRKQGGIEVFDSNDFGAKGSSSAIKRVLDRCG